jgi:hypothetical protein
MSDADTPQFRSLEREVREKHFWHGKDKARAVRVLPTAIASRKSSDGALGATTRDGGGSGANEDDEDGSESASATPVDQVLAELGEIVRTRTLTEAQRRDLHTHCSASRTTRYVPAQRAWSAAVLFALLVGVVLGRAHRA